MSLQIGMPDGTLWQGQGWEGGEGWAGAGRPKACANFREYLHRKRASFRCAADHTVLEVTVAAAKRWVLIRSCADVTCGWQVRTLLFAAFCQFELVDGTSSARGLQLGSFISETHKKSCDGEDAVQSRSTKYPQGCSSSNPHPPPAPTPSVPWMRHALDNSYEIVCETFAPAGRPCMFPMIDRGRPGLDRRACQPMERGGRPSSTYFTRETESL